ncbi:predicted protein [Sclerotinia sclerotiorum 1980 UF-70]|uniref:Uncharacterized protein n=1 Tax=Sclerotinia sclerotiorum (strain ATCC 18683 / 1980 / Ss-1) TaxID=665079 RepID=A7EG86_SCLS1|nr:predicted protein [Sclerotinia sclerotiorum 1980 UF-70]EDO01852.1 predicted protein [Sclerotinia sclerotiorum 1980 UF-70]
MSMRKFVRVPDNLACPRLEIESTAMRVSVVISEEAKLEGTEVAIVRRKCDEWERFRKITEAALTISAERVNHDSNSNSYINTSMIQAASNCFHSIRMHLQTTKESLEGSKNSRNMSRLLHMNRYDYPCVDTAL